MIRKVLYLLAPIAIIVSVFLLNSPTDTSAYRKYVADIRAEKIRFLKHSPDSPFNELDVKFHPIEYFPIDPEFKVTASLEKLAITEYLTIQNSDGSQSRYQKYAIAHFELQGEKLELLILKPTGFGTPEGIYFTGFTDETSELETYGGGRYIDLEIGKENSVTIDFNLAYNPYCAYMEGYICPVPPKENVLPLKITAGEKDYKH